MTDRERRPTAESLKMAREIVRCTCVNRPVGRHFANCPIRDLVDVEVAEAIDAARRDQHVRTATEVTRRLAREALGAGLRYGSQAEACFQIAIAVRDGEPS